MSEGINLLICSLIILPWPWLRQRYFGQKNISEQLPIKNRIAFFDFIKGLAILAVIFIHVGYFNVFFPIAQPQLFFLYLTNNIARFAIPIFLICSGILLNPLTDSRQIKEFYTRKIWRIFLPYGLCTLAYALYFSSNVPEFFYNLISGRAVLPYYFIIVLIALYLLYPLLDKLRSEKYFLPACFAISLVSYFIPQIRAVYGTPLFLEFLFFFAYGLVSRQRFLNYQKDKQEACLWLATILFYLAIILIRPGYYYNTQLFYGLAIFNLLFYCQKMLTRNKFIFKLVSAFGKNSLWVYLLHFPLVYLSYILISGLAVNYYLQFLAVFISSVILAGVAAKIIQLGYQYIVKDLLNINATRNYA